MSFVHFAQQIQQSFTTYERCSALRLIPFHQWSYLQHLAGCPIEQFGQQEIDRIRVAFPVVIKQQHLRYQACLGTAQHPPEVEHASRQIGTGTRPYHN